MNTEQTDGQAKAERRLVLVFWVGRRIDGLTDNTRTSTFTYYSLPYLMQ